MAYGIKLTHLGQLHKLPFNYEGSPKLVEQMVKSQIKVANYIKKHPEALVFLEGLTESYSGVPKGEFTKVAQMLFPKGLPNSIDKLNQTQKEYLYEAEGAVRTMNRLGELKSMYRTISPEQSKIVDSLISKGKSEHIFETREQAAMKCIEEVLEKNPDKREVIVVYGDAHDFSSYCLDSRFQHEKISCVSSERILEEKSSEENRTIKSLNKRLKEYPKDISSRLKRATILLSEGKKDEALKDYKFVLKEYPANFEAQKGIQKCS